MCSSNKESKPSSKSSHHHKRHHESHRSGEKDKNVAESSTVVSRGFSFLFVVNNLVMSDSLGTHLAASADRWGNRLPPERSCDYEREVTSPVFRWQDGQGGIWGWTVDPATNMVVQQYMKPFETYTVFRGWRFLPVVFMDSDATTTNVNEEDPEAMNHALSFNSELGRPVSLAGPRGRLYAVGKDAAWVGRLVPDSYRNPYSDVQNCRGLAGSLPLILGLMGPLPARWASRECLHAGALARQDLAWSKMGIPG